MEDVEDRLRRLEALVEELTKGTAVADPRAGGGEPEAEGLPRTRHRTIRRGSASPEGDSESDIGHRLSDMFGQWRKVGRRMVVAGVAHWEEGSSATGSNAMVWDAEDRITYDARRAARLCQAMASEQRLTLLCELLGGARTTSELTTSTGLDRGQLYHHLRDLFVEALVEQPERGRYRLTGRGETAALLGAVLASTAAEAPRPLTLEPEEDDH